MKKHDLDLKTRIVDRALIILVVLFFLWPDVRRDLVIPVFSTLNKFLEKRLDSKEEPPGYNFWPKRIYVSHIQGNDGKCHGYATNYTTLGMLLAPQWDFGRFLPMVDLRGHRFDDYTFAANIGFVGRYVPDANSRLRRIYGVNVYYDWRQGCIGQYNQIGVGIEVIDARWDLRANAYVPFGPRHHRKVCVFDQYSGGYCAINRRSESTSYAFNAEFGAFAYLSNLFQLYFAIGPYYIARKYCEEPRLGGEVRMQPQINDWFALNLRYNYDQVFRSVYQCEVIVSLPLYQIGPKRAPPPAGIWEQRIYQRVERFEVMPLSRRSCWQSNF